MKKIIFTICFLTSAAVNAGGWSSWAAPTRVDLERGNGIMVYGSFDNPSQCTISNRLYIPNSHPEYDKIYALVLAAFAAQKEIQAYSHSCDAVPWYTVPSNTFNYVGSGAVNARY